MHLGIRGGENLNEKEKAEVEKIRTAWITGKKISTLPKWGQIQHESIEKAMASLKDADAITKNLIVRQLLITLRCHACERGRSGECNFSVCVRGLMSGVSGVR